MVVHRPTSGAVHTYNTPITLEVSVEDLSLLKRNQVCVRGTEFGVHAGADVGGVCGDVSNAELCIAFDSDAVEMQRIQEDLEAQLGRGARFLWVVTFWALYFLFVCVEKLRLLIGVGGGWG